MGNSIRTQRDQLRGTDSELRSREFEIWKERAHICMSGPDPVPWTRDDAVWVNGEWNLIEMNLIDFFDMAWKTDVQRIRCIKDEIQRYQEQIEKFQTSIDRQRTQIAQSQSQLVLERQKRSELERQERARVTALE